MKVLYVIPYPQFFSQHNGVGGHIAHCIGILQAMKEKGFEIKFFSEESDEIIEEVVDSLSVYPKKHQGCLSRFTWLKYFFKDLERQINIFNPDIIYMRYSASVAVLYPLLKRALGGRKIILEVNSLGSQHKRILKIFDKKMLSLATTVVCVSNLLKDYISQQLNIIPIVVPNGIDKDRIPYKLVKDREDRKERKVKIVYAGLLKPEYGLEFSIDSLEALKEKYNITYTL
ncbi:MAG: glycosyltransferase, partial [bacterium]